LGVQRVREDDVEQVPRRIAGALVVSAFIVGLGVFPATAAAKELSFQGGDEAFGTPPVGMTMTGKSFKKPKRVTGFSIGPIDFECYSGNTVTESLWTVPMPQKGIEIKKNKKGDRHFKYKYQIGSDPNPFMRQRLVGEQDPENPRKWSGKVKVEAGETGIKFGCVTVGDDEGFVKWKARFVGSE
jgi:hypothetical protein